MLRSFPANISKLRYLFKILQKYIWNVARSSLFLVSYCAIAWSIVCFNAQWGIKSILFIRVCLLLSGLSVFLEPPSRRMELALYCLPRAAESTIKEMIKYNTIPKLKHIDLLAFCAASAGTIYCYEKHPEVIKPAILRALKWLWS